MQSKLRLTVILIVVCIVSLQAEERVKTTALLQPVQLELGFTYGLPGPFNAFIGYWGAGKRPLVAGLSGGYNGKYRKNIRADVGFAFDNEGSFRQVLGMTFGTYVSNYNTGNEYYSGNFVDPYYSFNLSGFKVQFGTGYGFGGSRDPGLSLIFQIGYVKLIEL